MIGETQLKQWDALPVIIERALIEAQKPEAQA